MSANWRKSNPATRAEDWKRREKNALSGGAAWIKRLSSEKGSKTRYEDCVMRLARQPGRHDEGRISSDLIGPISWIARRRRYATRAGNSGQTYLAEHSLFVRDRDEEKMPAH